MRMAPVRISRTGSTIKETRSTNTWTKGSNANQWLDQKSDLASEHGKEGLAKHLDRKGQKVHRKMHKKGQKIDRKMHNTGFQHGMSQALNNGKGKKKGLHRKMR